MNIDSRRSMRIYTINALLWQMAVFDALTMTSYAIYIMRFRLIDDENSIGFVILDFMHDDFRDFTKGLLFLFI